MKDSIRERFKKAIEAYKESEQAVRTEQQHVQDERRKFEAGWAAATISIVVPALEEIASKFLIPNGWEGAVKRENVQVIFEVSKGDMLSMHGGFRRPTLTISPNTSENGFVATIVTTNTGAPIGSFTLENLTADLIQEYAAKFFEKLSEERAALMTR
jgi:hypothetical protein